MASSCAQTALELVHWQHQSHCVRVHLPAQVLSRLGFVSGYTALGLAVNRGNVAVTSLLLTRGADPDIPICENGATPLMIAAVWNRVDVADLLLLHGAAIDIPAAPRVAGPYAGGTALEVAQQRGRDQIAALIRQARAHRRFVRIRRPIFLAGRFLLALNELYADVHYRPGGLGEKDAALDFVQNAQALAIC